MTEEEAKKVLERCNEYIGEDLNDEYDSVLLDGHFTLQELEAIIVIKRARQSRSASDARDG